LGNNRPPTRGEFLRIRSCKDRLEFWKPMNQLRLRGSALGWLQMSPVFRRVAQANWNNPLHSKPNPTDANGRSAFPFRYCPDTTCCRPPSVTVRMGTSNNTWGLRLGKGEENNKFPRWPGSHSHDGLPGYRRLPRRAMSRSRESPDTVNGQVMVTIVYVLSLGASIG